jgi:very-short-patch-repair endonuclease
MNFFHDYNKKHTPRAKELRKAMTPAERKIWYDYFQPLQKQIGMRILRQRPINQFIVDFYIPKAKLVIEIDGETHFTEDAIIYDRERTEVLEGLWIRVLRFTNNEVMTNLEWVAFEIQKYLHN